MDRNGWPSRIARRLFLTRVAAGAGIVGASAFDLSAAAARPQTDPASNFKPARHAQDDWYDQIPGVHRFLFDTDGPDGFGWAMQFATNFFTANESAYGLKDSDLAVIVVARHKATSFAYNDAMWAKYGAQLSEQSGFVDPKTKEPPKTNYYAGPGDGVTMQTGKMDGLIKKGAQFAVCSMSTRGIATRIAKAHNVEVEAVVKEITSNLVPNSHMVPAGIVAVNRAQEHGYAFIYAS